MSDTDLKLGRGFALVLADNVLEARRLVGWTQRELAARAQTSQTMISRIERGRTPSIDVLVAERVLTALGMRASFRLDARHLADRRRQRDALHARLTGFVARRLNRLGWLTATEVPLGDGVPRGWIDLLAYRPADRGLLIEETKTEILDLGDIQRSLAFYERAAWAAARRIGWRPLRSAVLLVALDTEAIGRRLADNREIVRGAFPTPIPRMTAWLTDAGLPPPRAWTLGISDPAVRGSAWLRTSLLDRGRRAPAYRDYADAAGRLLRR